MMLVTEADSIATSVVFEFDSGTADREDERTVTRY